jgi:hypothetical protein
MAEAGAGLDSALVERAVAGFWPGRPLRLDGYDGNPNGARFWVKQGFVAFSRLMKRAPSGRGSGQGM